MVENTLIIFSNGAVVANSLVPSVSSNSQIVEFLDYYVDLMSPQYAVMIQAPWGAGKTWFVKSYFDKNQKKRRPLYVTLNGVATKGEIEDQFFEQIHPFLSNKATKIGAKVLKGLIKGTLHFDLDADGKSDGSAAVSVPDVGIKDFIEKSEGGSVIIFDDLERCEMPMHQILGYINYFVEHDNTKVIIIANEEEIIAKELRSVSSDISKEDTRYLRIREKLIGKTFSISPDVDAALDYFLEEVGNIDIRKILQSERELIISLHKNSESKNLRHLRQAILDYERLIRFVGPAMRNSEMLRGLLATFLVYSVENRSGNLQPEQLIESDVWFVNGGSNKKSIKETLREKYPMLDNFDSVLSGRQWAQLIATGLVDGSELLAAISQSKYYAKDTDRADWLRLNEAFQMDDDKLEALLAEVVDRLRSKEYQVLGELMHITGSLLSLASIGVCKISPPTIVKLAIGNALQIKKDGLMPISEADGELFEATGWCGRSFHSRNDPYFQNFSTKIEQILEEALEDSYPKKATHLLSLLQAKNTSKFLELLSWSKNGAGLYAREPVFSVMSVSDFVAAIDLLNAEQLATVGRAMKSRYEHNKSKLKDEEAWLGKVADKLGPLARKRGKMSDFYKLTLKETIAESHKSLSDQ